MADVTLSEAQQAAVVERESFRPIVVAYRKLFRRLMYDVRERRFSLQFDEREVAMDGLDREPWFREGTR